MLLFIVSMITFAIFFLVPRWPGPPRRPSRRAYVGRTATAETVHVTAERLGFYDPLYVQYGRWAQGHRSSARDYDYGTGVEHCPAPCFGYSFITRQPVWPDLLDRLPVTLSLAVGAVDHLAGLRRRPSACCPRCDAGRSSTGPR